MKKYILFITAVTLFTSCISNRKIASAKNKLANVKEVQKKEAATIEALDVLASNKIEANKIDSNILERIAKRLAEASMSLDSSKQQAAMLDSILLSKKKTRKNYREIILPVLDSLKKKSDAYAQRLELYMMINEGLNVADFELFDLAAFFGPGKYQIPDDKVDIAEKSFTPLVDSLIAFSNKYSHFSRKATLIILGFADGMGYTAGSPLYDTLMNSVNKTNISKIELNQVLSELRANELITQLTNLYLKKSGEFKEIEKLHIEFVGQGKGEQLPMPAIKDYKEDDERRRIVLCYWVVLPD